MEYQYTELQDRMSTSQFNAFFMIIFNKVSLIDY